MVELPKDAEGLEIPLDTVALYDDDGNVHNIRRFIYTNDFDLGDKWINSWVMVVDDYKTAKPEQMHLTSPDSWGGSWKRIWARLLTTMQRLLSARILTARQRTARVANSSTATAPALMPS